MSAESLKEAYELINKNYEDKDIIFSTPKSREIINKAEDILGINFPKSYKSFIEDKGFGGVGSFLVAGIRVESEKELNTTGIVWATLNARNDLDQPHHLIPIEDIGNGDIYCLDTSQTDEQGECPVVVWPIGGYEQTPVLEVVAKDFGEFFLNMVKQQIEYKKQSES